MEPSGQETLQPLHILSVAPPYIRDIPQRGIINRGQALPAMASLYPGLQNFQPRQDLQTTRLVTTETNNFTQRRAAQPSPATYYENQQNLQSES
jgi:hypothetical protein